MNNAEKRTDDTAVAELSQDDQLALQELDEQADIIRDRVASVALGFRSALYLFGPGGNGKSDIVRTELARLGVESLDFNSRMTGRGIFNVLKGSRESIHKIEDTERLLDDLDAQGVLRAASGGENGQERLVTWTTADGVEDFVFRGGIIIISNRPLSDRPILRAVATRFSPIEWLPTDRQLAALMRDIGTRGFIHKQGMLSSDECLEVAEFIIENAASRYYRLDLRLLFHGFADYIQWKLGKSRKHWKELVLSMLLQQIDSGAEARSRAEQKQWEQDLLREIMEMTTDGEQQIRLWTERVKKSEKSFYRRRREVLAAAGSNGQKKSSEKVRK